MNSNPKSQPIQRRLVLIRHAKAVEEDVGGDHARGLSARGREEAASLANWLKAQGITPDLVLCSTASRTRETLAALGSQLPTILSEKLYLATPAEMLAQIQQVDERVETLMVIGHNPGIRDFLNSMRNDSDDSFIELNTAACCVLTLMSPAWVSIDARSVIDTLVFDQNTSR